MLKREEIWGTAIGVLILILWGWGNYSASQNASQHLGKVDRPNYEQASSRQSKSEPVVTFVAPADQSRPNANQAKAQEAERGSYHIDVGVTAATLLLCAFVLWQIQMFKKQLGQMSHDTSIALEQSKAITLAERAYVQISHAPPGLTFSDDRQSAFITLIVTNSGRTPATATTVFVDIEFLERGEAMPVNPVYDDSESPDRAQAFLMTSGHITMEIEFDLTEYGDHALDRVEARLNDFVVYGYVDYLDEFKAHHRGGYARIYECSVDSPPQEPLVRVGEAEDRYQRRLADFEKRSNLLFLDQVGYNYDSPHPTLGKNDKQHKN